MKYLKLQYDDDDLFKFDSDPSVYQFFFERLSTFRKMWHEQGSTFWLRFLVTFRKFFTDVVCVQIYYETDNPICFHVFLQSLEHGFIHIHKTFIEENYNSAKRLMQDIHTVARNCHLIPEMLSPSSVYNPFYSKSTRDAFRNLFGLPQRDKILVMKILIIGRIYRQFAGAICNLMKRYITENYMPENEESSKVYWTPILEWLEPSFKALAFEKYIAKYWDESLSEMLIVSDLHIIFRRRVKLECCLLSAKSLISACKYVKSDAGIVCPVFKYCHEHKSCRKKIRHDSSCKQPYFCDGSFPCFVTCETLSGERKNAMLLRAKISPNGTPFWKRFEVEVFECKNKKCRDVSTYCETFDVETETFVSCMGDDRSRSESPPLHLLPPEMLNSFNQMKRIEQTKARLRNKLDKKQKMRAEKEYDICCDSSPFDDPEYRMLVYKKAKKKFQKELEVEVYAYLFTHKNISPDHEEIFCDQQCVYKKENPVSQSLCINDIAVGNEEVISGIIIIPQKKSKKKSGSHKKVDTAKTNNDKDEQKIHNNNNDNNNSSYTNNLKKEFDSENKSSGDKNNHNLKTSTSNTPNINSQLSVETKSSIDVCSENISSSVNDENDLCNITANESVHSKKNSTMIDDKSKQILNDNIKIKPNENDQCKETCDSSDYLKDEKNMSSKLNNELEKQIFKHDSEENCLLQQNKLDCENAALPNIADNKLLIDTDNISEIMPNLNKNIDTDAVLNNSENLNKIVDVSTNKNNSETVSQKHTEISENSDKIEAPKIKNETITDKLNFIEKGLKENGGLGYDEIMEVLQVGNMLVGATNKKEKQIPDDVKKEPLKDVQLRICAYCKRQEVKRKTFKKCSKCKLENFPEQRYYCSRECQIDDWEEIHREEHLKHSGQ